MTTIILTSIFSASLIYEIVAILGYLSFGSRVTANIIAMYPSTTLFIAGGQLAIVVLVMFSYPLQVHPCRICLDKVVLAISGGDKDGRLAVQTTEEEAAHREENSEDEDSAIDADHDHGAHEEMTALRHILLTAAIVLPGFVIAYFVNSLQRGEPSFLSDEKRNTPTDSNTSALDCGVHWLNRDQLYPTRTLLLETIQGRPEGSVLRLASEGVDPVRMLRYGLLVSEPTCTIENMCILTYESFSLGFNIYEIAHTTT